MTSSPMLQRGAASAPVREPIALPPLPAVTPARCALVGEHAGMREVYRRMQRAAPTLAPVLLVGETGTGREAIAHCIHERSPVASGPWVAVPCATADAEALDRDLFGSERESDQGRMTRELGGFERASGGTIFLDEIAGLTPPLQARLLHALQEGGIERVGSGEIIPVHARVIASSTRDLRHATADGRFRDDLYFRLAIVTIQVPRLADRGDDLLLLVASFAQHFLRRAHATRRVTHVSARALDALRAHQWSENVRELRSAIEHAVLVTPGETIDLADLPDAFQDESDRAAAGLVRATAGRRGAGRGTPPDAPAVPASAAEPSTGPAAARSRGGHIPTLAEIEARHIAFVLAETQGSIHLAAALLGIHRNTLTRKIREYRL